MVVSQVQQSCVAVKPCSVAPQDWRGTAIPRGVVLVEISFSSFFGAPPPETPPVCPGLEAIDTMWAAAEPGDGAGQGEVETSGGAEQFHAHEGACEGCFGSSGENGHHTDASQQRHGQRDEPAEGVAQAGADEEEGRNFSAFETCRQGKGGEQDFQQKIIGEDL